MAKPLAPQALCWTRGASSSDRSGAFDQIDKKREQQIQEQKLPVTPGEVSTSSTVVPTSGQMSTASPAHDEEPQMMAGVMHDIVGLLARPSSSHSSPSTDLFVSQATIRETFSLEEVPKQAYYMGLAGVVPYMVTSLSTVYCAWEINHATATGTGLFLTERSAEDLLHIIEPLQVGYGAVVCHLAAQHPPPTDLTPSDRSSPSSAPSIGVSNGLNTVALRATLAT